MLKERTQQARYPRHRASVRAARAHARQLADEWNLSDLADPLELVVSELVSNAIVHATTGHGREVAVVYQLTVDRLRVEVRDAGDGIPVPRTRSSPSDESGRGLLLVQALTHRWGIVPHVIGKSVWAEFMRPAEEEAD